MKVLVAGGTGFIGTALVPALLDDGIEVALLARPRARRSPPTGVRVVEGDPLRPGPWQQAVADYDATINLVGEQIDGRWTPAKRARIRSTRVQALNQLAAAMPGDQPHTLISASAVGYYGDAGERLLSEQSPAGSDFLARVAVDWERAALRGETATRRVVITRLGVVLGPGGALAEMVRRLRGPVGAVLGSGRQWLSWVHERDVVRAYLFLLRNPQASGVYNLCSPNPVRQAEMARALARALGRAPGLPMPARALRLALGEFANVLLASQRMSSARLRQCGFRFEYPELAPALAEILGRLGERR